MEPTVGTASSGNASAKRSIGAESSTGSQGGGGIEGVNFSDVNNGGSEGTRRGGAQKKPGGGDGDCMAKGACMAGGGGGGMHMGWIGILLNTGASRGGGATGCSIGDGANGCGICLCLLMKPVSTGE